MRFIKVTVTLPVTFLAFIGFSLSRQSIELNAVWACMGVFLLAGAASAFNQIIEKKYDALMERTRLRPLPSGQIKSSSALLIVIIMTILGIIILAQFNMASVLLGFITLFWYITVYTFLKRKTAFAVIPGSLTGALPPLIGWVAAGGKISDPHIIYISIFVFIWQIPHFWLLILMYGKEYQQAGFPSLFDFFNEKQIQKWTFVWIVFSSTYSIIYPVLTHDLWFTLLISFFSFLFIIVAYLNLIQKPAKRRVKTLFHLINSFMILLLLAILLITL
jgi:protoheme IX farnesyltransferase